MSGLSVAALMTVIIHGPMGWAIAGVIALPTLARAWVAARDAKRRAKEIEEQHRQAVELRLIALAKQQHGALTTTAAAQALGVSSDVADRYLTAMADGSRITVEVDSDGIVRYVFREVIAEFPQIRAETESEAGEEADPASRARRERSG